MISIDPEIEVKFFPVDLSRIRDKMATIEGAKLVHEMRLMKRVIYGREANPAMRCTYGRVRDEGGSITMSAKFSAKNNDTSSQKEAIITIDSFEQGKAILDSFGLVATDYQESKRETWQIGTTMIELEEWPNLPTYIEIESGSIDNLKMVAEQLGLDWDKRTVASTDQLFMQHNGWDELTARRRLANLRFDK